MTNVRFPSIHDYPDVAARNFYNLELAKGIEHNEIMQIIYITGRDNARTPMQWDDSLNAGFSTAQQTWIGINPNYVRINVAQQAKDEHSILNFYKRLIRTRKENNVFTYGIYDLILSSHQQIYGYTRTSETKRAYVLTNLTDRVAQFTLYQGLSSSQLFLSNLIEPVPEHKVSEPGEYWRTVRCYSAHRTRNPSNSIPMKSVCTSSITRRKNIIIIIIDIHTRRRNRPILQPR